MAVIVRLNEKKEPVNEILGTLLAWGLVAGLIAKVFGIKFNFSDTDEMRQWGLQFGDAFKFSRQKIKGSRLPPDLQERCQAVMDRAERRIRQRVTQYGQMLDRDPTSVLGINMTDELLAESTKPVNDIKTIIGGDEARAREIVQPLEDTFDELKQNLAVLTTRASMAALSRETRFIDSIRDGLRGSFGRDPTPDEINNIISLYAAGIVA